MAKEEKSFRITGGRGFHITFPNGVTLSSQFGGGNYCDNYNSEIITTKMSTKSNDCEIAIWNRDEQWITEKMNIEIFNEKLNDAVKGHVNIEEWLRIFDWCRNFKEVQNGKRKEKG